MLIVRWMNNMKVLYKGKKYKVYGVSPSPYTQGYYYEKGADFLIYIKNSWVWVSSDYCTPYKKKKHKKRGSQNKKGKICL